MRCMRLDSDALSCWCYLKMVVRQEAGRFGSESPDARSSNVRAASQSQKQQTRSLADGAALIAIKQGMGKISEMLAIADKRNPTESGQGNSKGEGRQTAQVLRLKAVTFTANSQGEKFVKEPSKEDRPKHALTDYLSMPLDQYALLDPRFIARDPENSEVFLFSVPLQELIGVDLQPHMEVKVVFDDENAEVRFSSDGLKLGDPKFDDMFQVDMQATLRSKPVMDVASREVPISWRSTAETRRAEAQRAAAAAAVAGPLALPATCDTLEPHEFVVPKVASSGWEPAKGSWRAEEEAAAKAAVAASEREGQASYVASSASASAKGQLELSRDSVPGPQQQYCSFSQQEAWEAYEHQQKESARVELAPVPTAVLSCTANISLTINLSPPLSVVPGPLMSITGGLMARIALESLVPAFLELLSVDYERWACGLAEERSEPAGSLVSIGARATGGAEKVYSEGNISVYTPKHL
eukprot:gene26304-17398_t